MGIEAIADAKKDFDHWLEARKPYLTSSDMFSWREIGIPEWWSDTRDSIIDTKFGGGDKEFDYETYVSMTHGTFDEVNIMAKFGKASGAKVEPCNKLFVNDRWPSLAASIDGFVYAPKDDPDHYLFQAPEMLDELIDNMVQVIKPDTAILCEIKKSTSVKWQIGVPDYYIPQLQTQMHILDLPAAVIVTETIKRGADQKWRLFWDMRAYLVLRNPVWESKLDQANKEFEEAKEMYGAQSGHNGVSKVDVSSEQGGKASGKEQAEPTL